MNNDELGLLLQRYDDDSLSEEEKERLIALLATDNGAQQLVDTWWTDGALSELLRGTEHAASVLPNKAAPHQQGMPPKPRQTRFRRLGVPLAAAAALVVIGYIWNLQTIARYRAELSLQATRIEGTVTVVRPDGDRPLQSDERLEPGQTVRVGEGSRLEMEYTDGTSISVEANSVLVIVDTIDTTRSKHLLLESGAISASVKTQPDERPMRLTSAFAEATVLGTILRFAARSDGTRLEVTEGRVQLIRRDKKETPLLVTAGSYADTADRLWAKQPLPPTNTPARGLVLHLDFEDALADSWQVTRDRTKAGNHLQLTNAQKVAGVLGRSALGTSGTGSYGQRERPALSLQPKQTQISLAAWARSPRPGKAALFDYHHILAVGADFAVAGKVKHCIWIGSDGHRLAAGAAGDHADLTLDQVWTGDNRWKHVVITYDGEIARLYLDGRLVREAAKRWLIEPGLLRVGSQINNEEFWHGAIDDVRIYNRRLEPDEIRAIHALRQSQP